MLRMFPDYFLLVVVEVLKSQPLQIIGLLLALSSMGSKHLNNQVKKQSVSFSDIESNHKNIKQQLSIVEEGEQSSENSDTQSASQSQSLLQVPTQDYHLDSVASSAEHLAANTKANHHSSYNHNLKVPEETTNARRPSILLEMQEMISGRRPSAIMASLRRGSQSFLAPFRTKHDDPNDHVGAKSPEAVESRRKNRRYGDDALSTALSALYAKMVVILGIALPITEVLSNRIPAKFYQGFYIYLYTISIAFVIFVYASQLRQKAVQSIIKNYHEKTSGQPVKKPVPHFGSFYLRIGAIAFGIGTMVFSGIELGQYFELESGDSSPGCHNIFMLLTPLLRMILSIAQMQFIFLNTTELDMGRHKVISRFGLMHMVATNLCEWLYTLVEETKHEIWHLAHSSHSATPSALHSHEAMAENISLNSTMTNSTLNATLSEHHLVRRTISSASQQYQDCQRTNIMGSLVQNASPFLFPCTIEYSLICGVILFEMWKQVKSIPEINRTRRNSVKPGPAHQVKSAHQFSIDCSKAHRGMFAGIVIIVLTIICLIMYFVLHEQPDFVDLAIKEVTYYEIFLYTVCGAATLLAFFRMRDLKFHKKTGQHDHHADTIKLDCTLLVMAGIGVYVYGMFSIIGSIFAYQDDLPGARDALVAETLSLVQVSTQTLFILNACWRRCKGATQVREKPGRQIVTFLLVANISMWFINTLIKGHASFRPSHLEFFGQWAWVIITHVSMPLAIFYRFHSTICLFDIWKSAYKFKVEH